MRHALKIVVVVTLAFGSVVAGVGAANASPDQSIAGGLGCCRVLE